MRSARLMGSLLLTLATSAGAQEIRFEKYRLPNGMTVILHEDHGLPVVGINTWFRVGSKDEPPGRSGFAHLFEHLMFMGTERVPGNAFDVIMESGGGANNASTNFDYTNYYSNGPSSLLPTLLWLDADRLEDLARTMTQEKLDLQRDVVRNERRQSIENEPYGKAELLITELMFPGDHPYHNEVIGTHADLEAATVQNVTDFFATFYVPRNASLVVAGDFDPEAVKPLIAGLFGTLPAGAPPTHRTAPPVRLGRVERAVTVDQVQLPRISLAYHSPPAFADGDAEMDLVGAILSDGDSSRLYRRLITAEALASDVSAFQSSAALQSVFRVDIVLAPGAEPDRVEAIVDEEIERLRRDGVRADELARHQATIELAKLARLQNVGARADQLNEYEFHWGDPDGFKRDLDRYRNATPDSVGAWARRVLTPDSRLIVRVLPAQPERGEAPTARDARPSDFAVSPFAPPAPETFTLANGLPVMLWTRPELPLVSMEVLLTPGGVLDAPASAGLSDLTAEMLGEGAGTLDAEQFSDAVQALGATFAVGASLESASASLTVVKRNLAKAADLAGLALRRPRLAPADFSRLHRLRLDELTRQEDEPAIVASRVGLRALYGDASPLAWPAAGTRATVEGITLDAVRARHAELFSPAHATILIAGDLTRAEAEAELARVFGDWKGGSARRPAQAIRPAPSDGMRLVIVDRPGAVQTVVRFVAPGIPAADERRVPLRLLNTILGGSFTSRLNQNLREKNGYTYGARSQFAMEPSGGYFSAGAAVRADVTGPAIREFLAEFARLRAGDISEAEAGKARETLRAEAAQRFQGLGGVLASASALVEAGLPFGTLGRDLASMQTIAASDLNRLAGPGVDVDHAVLVLVGDKATILEQIRDLGLPKPVELTASGERIDP